MSTLRKILTLVAQVWSATLALLLFLIFLVPPVLLVLPFNLKNRLRVIIHGWRLFSLGIIRIVCGAKLYREDHRPEEFKKFPIGNLYICNHQSMVDIPTLLTMFQIPPVMKKEVLYMPFFGLTAWASGAIVVDRHNKDSRKIVFEKCKDRLLKDKLAVQYYPEGTRSKNGQVRPYSEIKKPLMEFAYDQNIPVIPCSIYGTNKILSDKGVVSYGHSIGVKVAAPLFPKDFADKESFCHACWEQVQKGHTELEKKLTRAVPDIEKTQIRA